jgi:hypothetical protein
MSDLNVEGFKVIQFSTDSTHLSRAKQFVGFRNHLQHSFGVHFIQRGREKEPNQEGMPL